MRRKVHGSKIEEMTSRAIYNILRFCPYCRISTKVYRGMEWIKRDEGVVGFVCNVNSNLNKSGKIEKVRDYCRAANLPVIVIDEESHLTRFSIRIVK